MKRNMNVVLVALPALLLVWGAVALAALAPLEVGSDVAHQLLSATQWKEDSSPTPNHLVLPDPQNLSTLRHVWGVWWPFGGSYLLAALIHIPLSVGMTLRLVSGIAASAGVVGWVMVGVRLGLNPSSVRLGTAVIGLASLSIFGFARLQTLDFVAFAAFPWILKRLLQLSERLERGASLSWRQVVLPAFLLQLVSASLVFVKYSFVTGAAVVLLAIALTRVGGSREKLRLKACALLVGLAAFALPILVIQTVNASMRGIPSTVQLNDATGFYSQPRGWIDRVATAADVVSAPGISISASEGVVNHFLRIEADKVNWLRVTFKLGIGILVSLFAFRSLRVLGGGEATMRKRIAALSIMVPTALLFILMQLVGANFFRDPMRFLFPFSGLVILCTVASVEEAWRASQLRLGEIAFGALLSLSVAFGVVDFVKNGVIDRRHFWRSPETGLTVPVLGDESAGLVVEVLERFARQRLMPVIATPGGDGSTMAAQLILHSRALLLNSFSGPLVEENGRDCYSVRSSCEFLLGAWNGVAVLHWTGASPSLEELRLRKRFPEIARWEDVKLAGDLSRSIAIGWKEEASKLSSAFSDSPLALAHGDATGSRVPKLTQGSCE